MKVSSNLHLAGVMGVYIERRTRLKRERMPDIRTVTSGNEIAYQATPNYPEMRFVIRDPDTGKILGVTHWRRDLGKY